MIPVFEAAGVRVFHGDCIEVMRELPDASVDAVVTDPPYGLEFMGKEWDSFGRGEAASNATAGMQRGGISAADGRPTFLGGLNPKCKVCGKSQRGGSPCRCERPEFTDERGPRLRAFQAWCEEWAAECFRVLKPGGHLLAFGGSRTWHRLAAGVEDAGFEIRDSIAWLYGSGFPKSLDVSKAIDKLDAADERLARAREFQAWLSQHMTPQRVNELTGTDMGHHLTTHPTQPAVATADLFDRLRPDLPEVPERIEQLVADRTVESQNFAARPITGKHSAGTARGASGFTVAGEGKERRDRAFTDEARAWEGWGTALKPAFEPIVVARKPLVGTVAANVLAYGTGALNIDATRIDASGRPARESLGRSDEGTLYGSGLDGSRAVGTTDLGRWPTNVVLDESQAAELDTQTGVLTSGVLAAHHARAPKEAGILGAYGSAEGERGYGDSGGASRFFPTFRYEAKAPTSERPKDGDTLHPTVKPLDLMRWLVRLVTPPGGTVLEPFAGSGTTLEACVLEGFECIGIEREADYLPLIQARLERQPQVVAERMERGEHVAPEGALW